MDYTSIKKEEIIKEVLKRVRPGQAIDYKKFKELYEPYKDRMREVEFAGILGIKYGNFMAMKYRGQRAKILKEMAATITEERKK